MPLESKSRFDRLRPLELGIRDLIIARLMAIGGISSGEGPAAPAEAAPQLPAKFQVLQRLEFGAIAA